MPLIFIVQAEGCEIPADASVQMCARHLMAGHNFLMLIYLHQDHAVHVRFAD